MKNVFFYNSSIGKIGIAADGSAVTNIYFEGEKPENDLEIKETPLIKEAHRQLEEYFNGKRKSFDLPLNPRGTKFQQEVWSALLDIPYGETRSYKDIAIAIENEKACRAVGMANNRNPLVIIIPCHRVIGANGKLVGYGGGIQTKEYLLKLESNNIGD